MTRRILAKASAGNATQFGSDDIDYINSLLTGVDQSGTDAVTINTDWRFTNTNRLRVGSSGSAYSTFTSSATAARVMTLPDHTGTLVTEGGTATITGKTVAYGSNTLTDVASTNTAQTFITAAKTFNNNILKLNDSAADHAYTISTPNLAANRTLSLPLLTGDDTVVTTGAGLSTGQTLTNTNIDAATNTLSNVFVSPDKKLVGFYSPCQTSAAGIGIGTLLSGVPAVTGTLATTTNATEGKYLKFTTAATTDALSGVRINHIGGHMVRAKQPRFKCRFRLNTQTDVRMFVGLYGSVSAFATGEDPFNAVNAIGVFLRAADTNFQIASNNGSGATVFADTGVAKDANIHTIEIKADTGDTGWQWSMDGGAFSSVITAEVPASATGIGPHVSVQNSASAAANMDMWYTIVECDP